MKNSFLQTDTERIDPLINPIVKLEDYGKTFQDDSLVGVMTILNRTQLSRLQYIEYITAQEYPVKWDENREYSSEFPDSLRAPKNSIFIPRYLSIHKARPSDFFAHDEDWWGHSRYPRSVLLSDIEPIDTENNPVMTLDDALNSPRASDANAIPVMESLQRQKLTWLQYAEYKTREYQPGQVNFESLLNWSPWLLSSADDELPKYILNRKPKDTNFWPNGLYENKQA